MILQKKKILLSVFLVGSAVVAMSQDLNREVYVVRPYEPTLSDAAKYNFLPSVTPMETTTPEFLYSISPKRLPHSFEPEAIKAARTVTTSLPKIYNSWLKLGLGNYSTPLAEFNYSNLRSRDYSYGVFLHHKSSHSKISLENEDRVNAGYVDNLINIYGKRFFSGVTLSGNLDFEQHSFSYYGYNTDTIRDHIELDPNYLKQRTFKPGFGLGLQSGYDPKDFNFSLNLDFDYFTDKQKHKEPSLVVKTSFTKEISGILGGLGMSVDYSKLSGLDTSGSTILRFNPWIGKSTDEYQFKLGFEGVAEIGDITRYYFYPRANLDFTVVKDVLIPFVGVSGELHKNNYQNLFGENMFIKPGLSVRNTSSNFIAYGGIKGNITKVVRFRADANLTVFKNYHFFVNDTVADRVTGLPLHNQFTVVYDDVTRIAYHGQLVFAPGDKFELMLDGKYYDYRTIEELKPWHKPDFDLQLDAVYRYNKLIFGAGIGLIGNRWVKDYEYPDDMKKLKPVFDGNLSIEYNYSRVLTVFADFYNLTERSYLIWNQYPSQRFNFLMGFSYKL